MLIDSSEGTAGTYYFQLDDLNTVHALLDHNGTAVERYDYSAYGETRILDSNGQTLMVDDDLDEEFDVNQDGIIDIGYPRAGEAVTPRVVASQSQFDNPFGYAGMRRDEHTGLYHTHYREYNPSLGRWLTPDPAGYQDGQNLYCYYPNVNGVDVLGLMEVRHELVGPVDKQAYPVFYPETWYEYPASFANNSITNLSYGLRNTLMLPFAGAGHATQKVEENVLGGRSINEVETAIGPAIPGPVDEILVPALAASKFFVISGKVTQKTGKYHRMEELEEAVRKIDKISDASQPLSKLSSDKVKLYKQYIRDIEAQTGMKISVGQRHELAKHLRNNSHSKILTQTERDAHRLAFSRKKESLIREWEKNTGQKWPTYSEDVLSGEKGNIFRKEGWKYDAHEVIENSFDSPLEWWNIHPAAAPTAHQGGVHRSAGPANKIFSE